MQVITIDGPVEIAKALSAQMKVPLVPIGKSFPSDLPYILVNGKLAHEHYPQAACKIILHKANERIENEYAIASDCLIWTYQHDFESTIEPLSLWIRHHLKERSLVISIIIPVYNRQEHLQLTLKALACQNFPERDYEIIVVDDGSKDESARVATDFGVRVFTIQNKGPGAARNAGIQAAQGDIIVFLDADILVSSNFLSEIRERFQMTNSLLLLGARRHLPEGVISSAEGRFELDSREKLLRRYSFCLTQLNCPWSVAYTCNFSITRNFLDDIFFDESFIGWGLEDIDFAYELYKKGANFVFSRAICGYHLHHDRKLTNSRYQGWLQNLGRFLEKHPDKKVQTFALFKEVFNPDIKANYFDIFDKFENRGAPTQELEICDITKLKEDSIFWIKNKVQQTSADLVLLTADSNIFLDVYLPFFSFPQIKSCISKEDWPFVEHEFRERYQKSSLCLN